jgi:hypothetical protein
MNSDWILLSRRSANLRRSRKMTFPLLDRVKYGGLEPKSRLSPVRLSFTSISACYLNALHFPSTRKTICYKDKFS